MRVDQSAIGRYRLAVNHLAGTRLGSGRLARAARAGLQDGSPWSGLLSLHARTEGVSPQSWRDPQLAQVFGPRGAVYLVPADDIAVFTLGALPVDATRVGDLQALAGKVRRLLGNGAMSQSELLAHLPELDGTRGLRWVGSTGAVLPTWDTVDTIVRAHRPPALAPADARTELARRFFRYLGPATVTDLQWFLDGPTQTAREVFAALESELACVTTDSGDAFVTQESVPLLVDGAPLRPFVLLPPDDPAINRRTARRWVPERLHTMLWPQAPPPGAVVRNDAVVGTWRRRSRRVTVQLAVRLSIEDRDAIGTLVDDLPLEGTDEPMVRFVDP